MPPVRNSTKGRMRLQTYSHFSNSVGHWMEKVNEKANRQIMFQWQIRTKSKPTAETDSDGSSQQDEDDDQQEDEELVLPTSPMGVDDAAREPIGYPFPSSSTMHMSTAPKETCRGNHLDIPTIPGAIQDSQTTNTALPKSTYTASSPQAFPPSDIYGATGYPYNLALENIYHSVHAPDPGANQYSQTTDTGSPEGTYTPDYLSTFAPQNIYSSAGDPYDLAPPNQYSSSDTPNPGTYTRAQNTNTVASDSMDSAGYVPALASSTIYTAANDPCHLAHTDGCSSAYDSINPATTVPDFGYIPSFTNSVPMAPPSRCTQPGTTYEARDDDFGLQQADFQPVWAQIPPPVAPHGTQPITTVPDLNDILALTNDVAMAPANLHTQPGITYEPRDNDFGMPLPTRPTVWEQNLPTVAPQSTQPVAAAVPAPVPPQENVNTTFSSPAVDPYMGADSNLDMEDGWL